MGVGLEINYRDNLMPGAAGIQVDGVFYPRSGVSYTNGIFNEEGWDHATAVERTPRYIIYAHQRSLYPESDEVTRLGNTVKLLVPATNASLVFA